MIDRVSESYRTRFGTAPETVAVAPGRLEILGNHTDYNEGVVLSVAVDRETVVAAGPTPGSVCTVFDVALGEAGIFDLDALDDLVPGNWVNYIAGIAVELKRRGHRLPAFNATELTTIPLSAGMSSSAALEISAAYAIGQIAKIELPWVQWAKIGQAAENNTVGARTGLLDQFSSIKGRKDCLVFSDFRSLEVENVPLPPGTALVVANSMVKHTLTNEYNERRERCEQAVATLRELNPTVRALRDVNRQELEAAREQLDITAYRRACHVVGENERVLAGIEALRRDDLETFGRLMYESHESSRTNFENSAPELDAIVEIGKALPGGIGARLSGGGFGGITVHLVQEELAESYMERLATAYRTRTAIDAETMICHSADGARIVNP